MKKKKQKIANKKKSSRVITVGRVIPDLVIWCFSDEEEIIRHYGNHLAQAIQLSYNLSNFGVESFGLEEEQ